MVLPGEFSIYVRMYVLTHMQAYASTHSRAYHSWHGYAFPMKPTHHTFKMRLIFKIKYACGKLHRERKKEKSQEESNSEGQQNRKL